MSTPLGTISIQRIGEPTRRGRARRGFSMLELLITMSIVAVLLGLLIPSLRYVRYAANGAVCATNLRQIGIGWRQYVDDHQAMPFRENADWKYGGASFFGADRRAVLASDRPMNGYVMTESEQDSDRLAYLFRSPLDRGYRWTERSGRPVSQDVFPQPTVFERFGTSYRANPLLLDRRLLDPEMPAGPIAEHEIQTMPSRMLLIAVPQWQIVVDREWRVEASWHPEPDTGNVLFLDGSVRHTNFEDGLGTAYETVPYPVKGPRPRIGTPPIPWIY
ncbi:MAG: type II secretion system protein [Phycisphaerales bacterium]|jgi:prepilin-type N-terminal cleavage/methylation domain-containing protein/prepilin-type processing-associated H-X9-DG protein